MMTDDERSELEDKCQAFGEALAKKDWKGAADAFEDMQSLADDDSPPAEEDGDKEPVKGKPLAALIIGSKK